MRIKGDFESRRVWIDGEELLPHESQKVYNHSPDGYNWSYNGSGPSQLALALALKICPDIASGYQNLKFNFVSQLPQGDFEIEVSKEQIKEMLNKEI